MCGFQAPEYTLVARTDHRVTWDHLLVLYGVFVARPQPEHGSRPRHCRSLWVGASIIIQMSGSQIIKLRKMCGHWAMITWVPRRPRRPPRDTAVFRCHPPPGDRWNIQWNMNPILMLNGLLTTPLSMRCCTGLSPFRISLWNMDAICFLNICVIH